MLPTSYLKVLPPTYKLFSYPKVTHFVVTYRQIQIRVVVLANAVSGLGNALSIIPRVGSVSLSWAVQHLHHDGSPYSSEASVLWFNDGAAGGLGSRLRRRRL